MSDQPGVARFSMAPAKAKVANKAALKSLSNIVAIVEVY